MRRLHLLLFALVPVLLGLVAFAALANAAPIAQTAPPVPSCSMGVTKVADPDQLRLGDTVKVTLVVTHACPVIIPQTDLVFMVDVSNSMTKGDTPRVDDPCGPDPGSDPLPTKQNPLTPEPTKDLPPGPGGSVPTSTACPTRRPVLPVVPPGGSGIDATPTNPGPTRPVPVTPTEPGGGPPLPTKSTPGVVPIDPTSGPGPVIPNPGKPSEKPGTEDLIREVQQILRQLLKEQVILDAAAQDRLRIGLVAFESRPHTISWPTSKLSRINSGIGRLSNLPHGSTNAALGFYRAHEALQRGANVGRDANKVIIVFSDGKFDQRTVRGIRKRSDTTYGAIGMGRSPDIAQLTNIASERRFVLTQRDYVELVTFVTDILSRSRPMSVTRLTVQDELAGNMSYVTGSGAPTVTVSGQLLEWKFEPPGSPVTMTYEVEPLEAGRWPVSARADALWTDSEARTGTLAFPPVEVSVIAPTVTATPENTVVPTSTPTPAPPSVTPTDVPPTETPMVLSPSYLPLVLRRWPPEVKPPACVPQEHTVDVAIVIDTSDSMTQNTSAGRPKLDAAIEAGQLLADNLKLDGGGDQVTVIGFNTTPTVATRLTSNRPAVRAALATLPGTQASGTKINRALSAALGELTGPAHLAANNSAVVLLTDGKHEGLADEVRAAAAGVRAAGISIYTVGIGDVDSALLLEIASGPEHYFYSPDAEGLRDIYERIANVIPCP